MRFSGAAGRLHGVQVVVAQDKSAGVALVQVFEQPSQGCLLRLGAGVVGLTADVETALVAHADRVGVVVLLLHMAVGADHPFRATWLNISVTTDNVVVADTEFPVVIPAMPRIYLSG